MLPCLGGFSNRQIHRLREWKGGFQGVGSRGIGELVMNGYKVSGKQDE